MSDLPEYKRSNAITPMHQPANFQGAFEEMGDSFEPTYHPLLKAAADLGVKVAQDYSNQKARQQGVEDANLKPGREFLPALGESDANYIKSYKQQEYANASANATKLLNSLAFDARKNPTNESLAEFESRSQEGIAKIMNSVSKDTQNSLTSMKNTRNIQTSSQPGRNTKKRKLG